MTQVTEQEQQRLTATSQQVAAKLRTFYDGLTAEEQQVLDLTFSQLLAEEAGADARGHANPILVRIIAKGVIFLVDRLASADWSSSGGASSPSNEVIGNKV